MKLTKEEKAILLRALQKARLHTPKTAKQEKAKMLALEIRVAATNLKSAAEGMAQQYKDEGFRHEHED